MKEINAFQARYFQQRQDKIMSLRSSKGTTWRKFLGKDSKYKDNEENSTIMNGDQRFTWFVQQHKGQQGLLLYILVSDAHSRDGEEMHKLKFNTSIGTPISWEQICTRNMIVRKSFFHGEAVQLVACRLLPSCHSPPAPGTGRKVENNITDKGYKQAAHRSPKRMKLGEEEGGQEERKDAIQQEMCFLK